MLNVIFEKNPKNALTCGTKIFYPCIRAFLKYNFLGPGFVIPDLGSGASNLGKFETPDPRSEILAPCICAFVNTTFWTKI